MTIPREDRIIFMIGAAEKPGDPPTLVLGIPKGAWEYIKDGHTNTFDLRKGGVDLKLLVFGCESHDAGVEVLKEYAELDGIPMIDRRGEDFSIKE